MAATAKDSNALTPREIEILGHIFKCFKSPPEIDLHKLAAECGMTNVGSASNAWGRIKKKLFADGATPPVTPGRKRKAAVPGDGANDEAAAGENGRVGGEGPSTPKRARGPASAGGSPVKKRTPKAKKTPAKVKSEDEGEHEAYGGDGDHHKIFTARTPEAKKTPAKVESEDEGEHEAYGGDGDHHKIFTARTPEASFDFEPEEHFVVHQDDVVVHHDDVVVHENDENADGAV